MAIDIAQKEHVPTSTWERDLGIATPATGEICNVLPLSATLQAPCSTPINKLCQAGGMPQFYCLPCAEQILALLPKIGLFGYESSGLPPINNGLSFSSLDTTVSSHQPSDVPEQLFTSVLCGCCCLYRCRRILTSGEEIMALRSSAILQHRICYWQPPPTPPISLGMFDMKCAMRLD